MYKFMNLNQRFCARLMSRPAPSDVLTAHDGGKEIIVELGLAAIAVGLLLFFKTGIGTLITGMLLKEATTSITGMFSTIA